MERGLVEYWPPDADPQGMDMEATLVHELLHVRIPADQESGRASVGQEQAIEAIAQALVALNRGVRR